MRQLRAEKWLLPLVALVSLAVDQITKFLVVSRLEYGHSVDLASWLAPILQITHITNTGVVFGLFQGQGDFFLALSLIIVIILLISQRHLPEGHELMRIAMGLQLGGALGNLTDRLLRGSVVDFIDLNFWPMQNWAIFNLADASILTGTILLAIVILLEQEPKVLAEGSEA